MYDENDFNNQNNHEHEDYLPPDSLKDYIDSPVFNAPLEQQVGYWKDRAKFFENRCFFQNNIIKDLQEREMENDSSDWWKLKDNDED